MYEFQIIYKDSKITWGITNARYFKGDILVLGSGNYQVNRIEAVLYSDKVLFRYIVDKEN